MTSACPLTAWFAIWAKLKEGQAAAAGIAGELRAEGRRVATGGAPRVQLAQAGLGEGVQEEPRRLSVRQKGMKDGKHTQRTRHALA